MTGEILALLVIFSSLDFAAAISNPDTENCYGVGFPVASDDYSSCPFQQWLDLFSNLASVDGYLFSNYFGRRNDFYLFCSDCDNGNYLNFRKKLLNCSGDEFLIETKNCSFPCFYQLDGVADIPLALGQFGAGEPQRGPFLFEAFQAAYGFDMHVNFAHYRVINGTTTHNGAPSIVYIVSASFSPCGSEFNGSSTDVNFALQQILYLYFQTVFSQSSSNPPVDVIVEIDNPLNCSVLIEVFL
jgi:hypothetical protein